MMQFKDLVITIMYFCIFVIMMCNKEIAGVVIILVLGVNYIILRRKYINYDKKLKDCLNNQRDVFINILSHDLRIPAIAQIRALELVKDEKLGVLNLTQKAMLGDIEESCRCILNLMSLMINTYSVENNNYKLVFEKFNISEIVIACIDELLAQTAEKNITFEYENLNRNIQVLGDKIEIKKVIFNLLFSSVMSAHTGQKISVMITQDYGRLRLTVLNKDHNNFCCDASDDLNYTSIGHNVRMGFCKKIIETHKGKIVENNLKNSLCFELPISTF